MDKKNIVIAVLAGILVLQALMLSTWLTRLLLLSVVDPADREHDLILTEEGALVDHDGHLITRLPKGTVLHQWCSHDLQYTDLGDPRVYKVYVEVDSLSGKALLTGAPKNLEPITFSTVVPLSEAKCSEPAPTPDG